MAMKQSKHKLNLFTASLVIKSFTILSTFAILCSLTWSLGHLKKSHHDHDKTCMCFHKSSHTNNLLDNISTSKAKEPYVRKDNNLK